MALPSNVGYGTVVGRFLLGYADGPDGDLFPDGVSAQGTLFFTPSPAYVKDASASPAPAIILPAVVEATLDEDGYLCGPQGSGAQGIRLVATNDTDLNPVNWTWKVDFRLTDSAGAPVPLSSFSFSLPQDTTVDLTVAMPVTSSNGTFYLVGPTGPSNVLSVGTVTTGDAGSSAAITITGTSPTQTVNFTIPKGDQGIQGEQGIQGPANELEVGSVTTGAAGSQAEVTITGTSPEQTINFVIPEGTQGIQGEQGIQGDTGPIGPTGATGIEWQGTWSNTADYVNNDAVFYNGASWFASGNPPVGDVPSNASEFWFPLALQGATGAQGVQGDQGIQGEQGIQGDQGIQGEKGDTGDTGPVGPRGEGLTILGTVAIVGDLPSTGNTDNDAYIVAADGHLYIWTDGTYWLDAGEITGPAGPGVPSGGVANDFLVKSSSTDYDTEWSNEIDGGSA